MSCRRVSQDIFPTNHVTVNILSHVHGCLTTILVSLINYRSFFCDFFHLMLHQISSRCKDSLTVKVQMLHFSKEMGFFSPTLKVEGLKPLLAPSFSAPVILISLYNCYFNCIVCVHLPLSFNLTHVVFENLLSAYPSVHSRSFSHSIFFHIDMYILQIYKGLEHTCHHSRNDLRTGAVK